MITPEVSNELITVYCKAWNGITKDRLERSLGSSLGVEGNSAPEPSHVPGGR